MLSKTHAQLSALCAIVGLSLAACSPQKPPAQASTDTASKPSATASQKPNKTIAISAIVAHPSLDAIRQGIIDELAAEGYVKGKNLTVNF